MEKHRNVQHNPVNCKWSKLVLNFVSSEVQFAAFSDVFIGPAGKLGQTHMIEHFLTIQNYSTKS